MKRIYIFDFLRGIAIFMVILLHSLLHEWQSSTAVESGSEESSFIVTLLFYFITMAGLFYVVMGSVNSYTMYKRISSKRNTPHQLAFSGLIMGGVLLVSQYLFRGLLSADSGILYFLIREGTYIAPTAEFMIGSSTLAMLGWTSIFIPAILSILFRKGGFNKHRRNYIILAVSAVLILALTPLIRDRWARDVVTMIDNEQYFQAAILGAFVYDLFPIFPYIGYGLFGCILGIAIARNERRRDIILYLLALGITGVTVGFIGNSLWGGIDATLFRQFSTQAIYNKSFMQYSQIGIFAFMVLIGLILFDFVPENVQEKRTKRLGFIRRFSMISLTVYLFEGLVMVILRRIADLVPFLEGWDESLAIVAIFGIINVLIWALFAKLWEKHDYKGTVEWFIITLIAKLSGKKSDKYAKTESGQIEEEFQEVVE